MALKRKPPKKYTEDNAYAILGTLLAVHRIIDTPPPPSIQKSPEALRAWDKLSATIREALHKNEPEKS